MNKLFELERRTVQCQGCGKYETVGVIQAVLRRCEERGEPYPWKCRKCLDEQIAREEAEQEKEDEQTEAEVDELVAKTGIGSRYILRTPPVRFVAEWLWTRRESNIILSGTTGTGKTTSVAILIRELVKMGNRVRYTTLAELCDGWRAARSDHEHPYATRTFLEDIEEGPDYLVVDECADKSVITESTQEFMFRLLDDIASGRCTAKVWLLGNFYKGSVADIFGDEAPAMRRITENFVCGRIDCTNSRVVPIFKAR